MLSLSATWWPRARVTCGGEQGQACGQHAAEPGKYKLYNSHDLKGEQQSCKQLYICMEGLNEPSWSCRIIIPLPFLSSFAVQAVRPLVCACCFGLSTN